MLKLAATHQTISSSEATSLLARHFDLSDAEESELIASGRQAKWTNRVAWAITHLYQAGLLARPERGRVAITETGLALLATNPEKISMKVLGAYPSYREFRARSKPPREGTERSAPDLNEVALSPIEVLDATYAQYRRLVMQDVLAQARQVSPAFFERLVVQLLVAMGYGGSFKDAAQAVGRSGDGGIDGIIKEDRLGLDFVAVQAKRWEHSVGREAVQAFAGSLMGHRASKGVLITTSTFTASAKEYAQMLAGSKIVLIDGERLAELMLDFSIGVTEISTYRIQRVDNDYFEAS
jgi:restriction system protein